MLKHEPGAPVNYANYPHSCHTTQFRKLSCIGWERGMKQYLCKLQYSGFHLYLVYKESGRPFFWQLNSLSMKGQAEAL